MKVSLSEREMLGVWNCLGPGTWGGNEDIILGQGELWAVFGIECRFGTGPRTVGDLSTVLEEFELSDRAVKMLVSILVGPGQKVDTGPHSAAALARLKAAGKP